jgi:uncharacterized protein
MTEKDFEAVKEVVLAKLDGLDSHLTYHSKEHTIDVMTQALRIAASEGISDSYQLLTLKFATLFHDIGFLETYANHEAKGCEMFLKYSAKEHFSETEIADIQSLIMATKLPQSPKNHLEEIICDADLDYLGRSDFFRIGDNLRKEFLHYNIVADNEAWEKLQLNFLKNHHYFTESSRKLREPVKQKNYSKLL